MGDALLSVENLHVSFSTENGVAEVLDGVNLSIQTGEIVGLVGESGCGKTTLARSILGILPKNSAKISDVSTAASTPCAVAIQTVVGASSNTLR